MSNVLDIQGLCKTYSKGFALTDVNLRVRAGCVTGFVGANGAGKTTTIRTALGLAPYDAGRVVLFGEPFDTSTDAATAKRLKERIGIVFDTCPFPGATTVKAAGAIMRHAYPTWKQDAFESYVHRFDLKPKQKISELSRGMGMKLQLACALSHEPDLLILDEATAGLDPLAREEMLDILRAHVTDERGILISSHITSDLEKIADEVVCIDQGRIAFNLDKDTITDEAGIARCRASEFSEVAASNLLGSAPRYLRREYGVDVLVPDRFAFARQFPSIPCDKASIDDYLQLYLKGETK